MRVTANDYYNQQMQEVQKELDRLFSDNVDYRKFGAERCEKAVRSVSHDILINRNTILKSAEYRQGV
jgi:hypothetical protein